MKSGFWYKFFIQPLFNILILFYLIFGNLGIAIIVITLLIRLILLPTSLKAAYSQKQLAKLAPELKKIQKKYKANREKLAQAQLELYKKYKINPASSCLPLLIQFPILIALYIVLKDGLTPQYFDQLYSFVPRPSEINTLFLGIDLSLPNLTTPISSLPFKYYILPILAGISQFILSLLTLPKRKEKKDTPEQVMTKQMLFIFPLMTVLIGIKLPAAIVLYWLVSVLFGIFQQIYINSKLKNL